MSERNSVRGSVRWSHNPGVDAGMVVVKDRQCGDVCSGLKGAEARGLKGSEKRANGIHSMLWWQGTCLGASTSTRNGVVLLEWKLLEWKSWFRPETVNFRLINWHLT